MRISGVGTIYTIWALAKYWGFAYALCNQELYGLRQVVFGSIILISTEKCWQYSAVAI